MRKTTNVKKERAVLVAVVPSGSNEQNSLSELTSLAETAGAIVAGTFKQKLRRINPATYIGKGKAVQLAEKVTALKADVVIFDNNLSPGQIRELENIVRTKVVDRSELILDIFATRAKTRQAKLQVGLAQLEYTYPRLTRMWLHLDSVVAAGGNAGAVGGIGTRGPGEQQLEIDRRLVNKRVTELKKELASIDARRIRQIQARQGSFKICLVGYTNSGKSTLLNRLTGAESFVEDRLFATLDTKTKKWKLSRADKVLLSDTVGFVKNLPHQLVASFKATLEEAVNSDLLLHIIDVCLPDAIKRIESVDKVLKEINCSQKLTLKVFNKIDAIRSISDFEMLQTLFPDSVSVSAKTGTGIEQLISAVMAKYKNDELLLRVRSRQSNGKVQSFLRAYGTIISEQYSDGFVKIDSRLGRKQLAGLKKLRPDKLEILSGKMQN